MKEDNTRSVDVEHRFEWSSTEGTLMSEQNGSGIQGSEKKQKEEFQKDTTEAAKSGIEKGTKGSKNEENNTSNDTKKKKSDKKKEETKERNEISEKYIKYLECIKNSWSSSQASKLLNKKLIKYISKRFLYMSSSLKVRVLTSFFYLSDTLRLESKKYLLLIASDGEIDGNGWVKKYSRILKPFITTGIIDINEIDTQTMHRILNYIDQNNRSSYFHNKQELEYIHMCDPIDELKNLENRNIIHLDEYKMFTPAKNFDCLLSTVIQKGINEFKN